MHKEAINDATWWSRMTMTQSFILQRKHKCNYILRKKSWEKREDDRIWKSWTCYILIRMDFSFLSSNMFFSNLIQQSHFHGIRFDLVAISDSTKLIQLGWFTPQITHKHTTKLVESSKTVHAVLLRILAPAKHVFDCPSFGCLVAVSDSTKFIQLG